MDVSYSEFLRFCFNRNVEQFYDSFRWESWRSDVAELSGDHAFNFAPPLFAMDGKTIDELSRRAVPIEEQYNLNLDFRKQLGIEDN